LGGTGFTGPFQVAYALARGHTVTVFNRGRTNPGLLPDTVEQLTGDRNGDLEALKGREWDAVIDVPATLPRWVRTRAQLLQDAAPHYTFISSISVYRDVSERGVTESAPLQALEDPDTEDYQYYGGMKAASEAEAERAFPGRALIVRPGLIVGPGDPTDRFTYWPVRADRGGEILAPGTPDDPVQFIDVRELAAFMLLTLEQRQTGIYNADAPAGAITMGELLGACQRVAARPDSTLTWVPADFLQAQEVGPWSDMPVWVPADGEYAGFGRRSTARAHAAGLRTRPIGDTVQATLDWWRTLPDARRAKLQAGIMPEREAAVLAAWHA